MCWELDTKSGSLEDFHKKIIVLYPSLKKIQMENKNKRIAKNAILLYVRMFITMIISIYTSRVVLTALGASDYGIYNIVGGIVAMVSFLNSSLSGATTRFITIELGEEKRVNKLNQIFSSAIIIHLFIALVVLILAESIGLYYVHNKLIVPPNRFSATLIVYQFSIISVLIAIIQIPFNALIIAHERMNIYAYISIFEAIFKIIIAYLLTKIENIDKLILYSFLILCTNIIIAIFYYTYCKFKFKESKIQFKFDKTIIKPIFFYSSWDLYGNFSIVVRGQGINMLQNHFFGPIVNAASGLATQVQNAIAGFSDNFLTAVKPQIVKRYAAGEILEMNDLVINSSKFSFFLLFLISFPLIIECSFILNLWLKGYVPNYTIEFCQISLINNLISIIFRPIMFSIHAVGRVKRISLINGTIYILTIPISYLFLKSGASPIVPFFINLILMVIGNLVNLFTLKSYIPQFSILSFTRKSIFKCLIIVIISSFPAIFIHYYLNEGWCRLFLVSISAFICTSSAIFYIGLEKDIRAKLMIKIKAKLTK